MRKALLVSATLLGLMALVPSANACGWGGYGNYGYGGCGCGNAGYGYGYGYGCDYRPIYAGYGWVMVHIGAVAGVTVAGVTAAAGVAAGSQF